MTTFTLQDLTPAQQVAVDKHEEMHKMFQDMGDALGVGKANEFSIMDEVHALGQTIADNTRLEAQAGTLDAPEPQHTFIPTGELIPSPDLPTIINTICAQLQLLATVISQAKAPPDTTPPEGTNVPSLQETISLTLQQADWFRTMVRHELVALDIEEIAKEAVESVVEDEVESYFEHRFDCTDHFDFDDAVSNEVHDRLDDVVRDRVMDSLEEVVAEKLSEASIKVEFN